LLKSKKTKEILLVLKEIRALAKQQTREKIIFVRVDNSKKEFGQEFQNSLKKDKVIFEPCLSNKYSLNNIIKRYIYLINKIARLIIYKTKLLY
jgi:hypothetical protein